MSLWPNLLILVMTWQVIRGEWQPPGPKFECDQRPIFPCECQSAEELGVELRCSNTNLATLAVGLANVAQTVGKLSLTHCNIERIHGPLFASLMMHELNIVDTPIKDIGDDVFEHKPYLESNLTHVNLINTWLTRLPPTIRSLKSLNKLVIRGSRLQYLPPEAFKGLGSLKELEISKGQISELDPSLFSDLRAMKRLRFYGHQLTSLPRRLFKNQLSSLELLDLSHNNFTKLEPHFFSDLRQLLWLNVSHNSLDELQGRAFARNSLLRVLHVDHNNIAKLDAASVRGMRFLRRLFLSDNEISRISRGTFRAVTRIGTIDLARNKLEKIDFQMFSDLRFIDTIDVAENNISAVSNNAFENIYLTKINLSHNALSELGANVFVNCENMTFLDLSSNNLTFVDPKAFGDTSYATLLLLSFNKFESMASVPLDSMRGLKVLNVSHNALTVLPKKTFPKLLELHTIDFSFNNISEIARSLFAPLFSLRRINLSHNAINSLTSSTFGKLPSLLELDLSHNKIGRIRRGVLAGLSSVRQVDLRHNELTAIPSPPISLTQLYMSHNKVKSIRGRQPWPTMNSLLTLDLDFNEFDSENLGPGRFKGLNTLGVLSLRNNSITVPPWEALKDLQSLQKLHLDGNLLVNLTKSAFGKLPVVNTLTLANNKLNNVSVSAFQGLLQLVNLDMSSNNLSYLTPGVFRGLVALRNLDLSHNKLEYLQNKTNGLLEDCLSIRFVNLSHNKVPFVTRLMFPEHRYIPYKLESVDLSFNQMPVLTQGLLVGTKHLKVLNVSNNLLNDIRKGINHVLANLTSLEVLDLSGNALTAQKVLAKQKLGSHSNLTVLNLASNDIDYLPTEEILMNPKLKVLDLSYNNLDVYSPELTDPVLDGLDVNYEGNPIRCNCLLRPLVHWLTSMASFLEPSRKQFWQNTICTTPSFLANRSVASLIEEQLVCEDSKQALKFRLHPDVQFRDIKRAGEDGLSLSWYVNTNEDVGDFLVSVRSTDLTPQTLLERDVSYIRRSQIIEHVNFDKEQKDVSLCLLVKTSTGRLRRWRRDQCKTVNPETLNSSISVHYNGFVIKALMSVYCLYLTFWHNLT